MRECADRLAILRTQPQCSRLDVQAHLLGCGSRADHGGNLEPGPSGVTIFHTFSLFLRQQDSSDYLSKIASGSSAETTKLGTSTTSLSRKSTATLQIA